MKRAVSCGVSQTTTQSAPAPLILLISFVRPTVAPVDQSSLIASSTTIFLDEPLYASLIAASPPPP